MLAAFKAASADSDSDASVIVSHKKKAILGVLPNQKQKGEKTPNHKGSQHYFVLRKKDQIHERKYKLNILRNCFVKRYDQEYIKEGLGGSLGNRKTDLKHNYKSDISVREI